MKALLKGPAAAAVAFLILLVVVYGASIPDAGLSGSDASYPFPAAFWQLADHLVPANSAAGFMAAAIICHAVACALLFTLVLAWTRNRVVSLLAGLFMALHPAVRPAAGDALLVVLPSLWVFLALLLHEQAGTRRIDGRSGLLLDLSAVGAFWMAMVTAPVALVFPIIAFLADLIFRRQSLQPGNRSSTLLFYGACVVLAVASPQIWPWESVSTMEAGGLGAGFRGLMLAPPDGVLNILVNGVGLLAGVAGVGALALGLRGIDQRPRWLLLHFGFGATWFILCHAVTLLPGVPEGSWGRSLALAGPALFLPSCLWRGLMSLWTRFRAELPASAAGAQRPVDLDTLRNEVAQVVRAQVESFLGAGRTGPGPGSAEIGAQAERWKRRQEAWEDRFGETGQKALGVQWTEAERDENVFSAFVKPHVTPASRVLEIGPAAHGFTKLLSPEVYQVVCLESSPECLAAARQELAGHGNVSLVLSDGSGLGAVEAGSIDLILSMDAFLALSSERVFAHLADFNRVLRPGGRGVLAFANLLDPQGFDEFARRALGGNVQQEGDLVQYLTPEIVRTLAEAADLHLKALHLSANGRDMLAVLERAPNATVI